jgi:RNA polymerase sigma-70 factor, ECF subfamily
MQLFLSTRLAKRRLHARMEPSATSEAIAATMDEPGVDIQDFERVFQLHRPSIFRFLLASLRDKDAAENLTQDCFLRAYRGRHRFRADAAIKTWLMQIAVNLVRDQRRNRRLQFWRHTQVLGLDVGELTDRVTNREVSPEAQALLNDQMRAIWEATEKLPEKQRTVFLLRFVEDMDLADIAVALGTKEGTVKVHLFRAVHKIRERMERIL